MDGAGSHAILLGYLSPMEELNIERGSEVETRSGAGFEAKFRECLAEVRDYPADFAAGDVKRYGLDKLGITSMKKRANAIVFNPSKVEAWADQEDEWQIWVGDPDHAISWKYGHQEVAEAVNEHMGGLGYDYVGYSKLDPLPSYVIEDEQGDVFLLAGLPNEYNPLIRRVEQDPEKFMGMCERYGLKGLVGTDLSENPYGMWVVKEQALTGELKDSIREDDYMRYYVTRFGMDGMQAMRFRTIARTAHRNNVAVDYDKIAADIIRQGLEEEYL